jgi:DNA-binding CsgD family transcriptional regulator/tetratricopeptide (TPR) repeat protein
LETSSTSVGDTAFVGRESEMGALLGGLAEAISGRGRLFLLGGEPGIGKTRLADEFSARAKSEGALVLWGRCWEAGGAPAYWPWIQSVRGLIRELDPDALRNSIGGHGAELVQMLPEIREALPDLADSPPGSPEAARFRLFDAVCGFLARVSDERPLVLVLEDLHVADASSLLLLRFVADQIGQSRLLVLGTYRDVEVVKDHPLAALLPELGRSPGAGRVPLSGLSQPDLDLFIQAIVGRPPPQELVAALHHETDGNPLFVGEVVRHLASEDRLWDQPDRRRWPIPEGIREVIGRRLDRLSAECRQLLALGSVLGRDFGVDVLKRLTDMSAESVLASLQDAVEAKLIVDVPGSRGRLRFAHALIRDTLYEGLGRAERVRLHRAVGEALEALYSYAPEPHLAELAYHFVEAAPGDDGVKAIGYARRAGDRAASLLAYEEAVRLYRMALQTLDSSEPTTPEMRCELLLAMGDAQTRAGATLEARETLRHAADLARHLDMPEVLARAALGYGGRFVWARAADDPHVIPLLEDALGTLGDRDSVLRARVLARLAGALRDQPSKEPRASLSEGAVGIARRIGDPATLAYTLDGRYSAIWNPDTLDERSAIADEIVGLAERIGDTERAFQGHHYRIAVFIERGDIPKAAAELRMNTRRAEELQQPAQQWYVAATRVVFALLEGRLAEAEGLIDETFSLGQQVESMHARGVVHLQRYALRRELGELNDSESAIGHALPDYTFWPWMQVVLVHLHAEQGRRADAAQAWEEIAALGFKDLPFDNDWLFGMTHMAEIAAFLGDQERASVLYDLLLPYAGLNAFGHPEYSTGAVDRPLGILAALIGHSEEAARHFEAALEMNTRMGARPWVAHTQYAYARMLAASARRKDRDNAIDLLADALGTGQEIGMVMLGERVSKLLAKLGVRPRTRSRAGRAGTPTLTPREREVAGLVGEGMSNRQIAERLFVSERTAETHVQNILMKLGFTSRTQVAAWAVREGPLKGGT